MRGYEYLLSLVATPFCCTTMMVLRIIYKKGDLLTIKLLRQRIP